MTTLVQQRNDSDCVIACLAMWTGRDYDEVAASVVRLNGGVCLWEAVTYLRSVGQQARRSIWWFHTHRAILDLPSVNFVGGMHAVYWDGEQIFDPNQGRPGRLVWTRELLTARPNWGGTVTETLLEDEPVV